MQARPSRRFPLLDRRGGRHPVQRRDIAIAGQPVDGAETDPGWAYAGFVRTNGTVAGSYFNAYFGEYRQYRGYDDALRTGPYNFGFLNNPSLQDWVEHFPYQDGLLVWYYDTSFRRQSSATTARGTMWRTCCR